MVTANSYHTVIGCSGPLGTELMFQLREMGAEVRGVCRSGQAEAPEGVEIHAGDVSKWKDSERLCRGSSVVYSCVGIDYTVWVEEWPRIVNGLIDGAGTAGAPLIFADNLYSYGPQFGPLTENLPLTQYGKKPALRARLAQELLDVHESTRVSTAIVRASDFYGPRVRSAMLGERVFPRALAGKPAQLIGDIDQPHTYTYVPDFARALIRVAEDPAAHGQVWHVPSAPAQSTRQIVENIYELAGNRPRIRVLPSWLMRLMGMFNPLFRELEEMRFVWDRPYIMEHQKFSDYFGVEPTSLEESLQTTLDWFRNNDQQN